jgi:hypothetical protein
MAADLSPEDQEFVRQSHANMARRHRENDYRPPHPLRAKMESMGPGIRVVQEATTPPVPIPGIEIDEDEADG